MRLEMKLTGMDGVLATLRSLPAEVVSKRGGPVKASLAKGARFLRDREREALRSVLDPEDESTGLLEENIIASRGKAPTSGKGERYLVRVKRKMYPGRKGEQVSTLKSANLKEYGSSKQPAKSFIRRTVISHGEQTISIITTDLAARIQKVVSKLAAQNKGR